MNIPNILTAIRLALVPVFPLVFFSKMPNAIMISSIVFVTAGLTDILDGHIARKYNMITKWGSILDPLADKLMSLTVLLSLTIKNMIPIWVILIIGIKELMMIIGGAILFKKGTFVPAKIYGKISTTLFYISVIALDFSKHLGLFLLYVTVLSALYSLYRYVDNFKNIQKANKK
jgi:cardiolipin synthase